MITLSMLFFWNEIEIPSKSPGKSSASSEKIDVATGLGQSASSELIDVAKGKSIVGSRETSSLANGSPSIELVMRFRNNGGD